MEESSVVGGVSWGVRIVDDDVVKVGGEMYAARASRTLEARERGTPDIGDTLDDMVTMAVTKEEPPQFGYLRGVLRSSDGPSGPLASPSCLS